MRGDSVTGWTGISGGSSDANPAGPPAPRAGNPSESQRMFIFFDLVKAQDDGASVTTSREQVAAKHQLSIAQVLAIEKEGRSHRWAPL